MAALKNRTVKTEDLEEFIGKKVTFTDEEGVEWHGEVTSINIDGSFRVDTGDQDWDLSDSEFAFDDVTASSDEEGEEEVPTEAPLGDEESSDDDEGEVPPEKVPEKKDKTVITKAFVDSLDFKELKQLVKNNNMQVPIRFYQKAEFLRAEVYKHYGFETGDEKPVEKKTEVISKPAKEKKASSLKVKKEKTVKIKKERIPVLTKYDIIADMLLEKKTYKEILSKLCDRFSNASEKENEFQLDRAMRFAKRLGFKIQE